MRLSLFIPGDPVAQPRQKFTYRGGRVRGYTPKGHRIFKWRKILAAALERVAPEQMPQGNVVVTLEFNFARPKAHYGTGRNSDVLKPKAPDAHTQKPDLDNLAKPVMDEMTIAGWLRDDSQVDELSASKYWCVSSETPGVEIEMCYD